MNLAHKFTGFYMVTVFYKKFYGCIGIKRVKVLSKPEDRR